MPQKLTRNTLYICVAGSQQFPQLFVGDVYGISELIEKIGVEVDTILKEKLLTLLFIVC